MALRRSSARYDPDAPKDRRHVRQYANQVQRAVAGVSLQVEALPLRDRVLVLNLALREALDDLTAREKAERRAA